MSDEDLDKILAKKNKEIDLLNERNERMKEDYESKIKNLMNSINILEKKASKIEEETRDNVRVEIIRKLRQERKDQEQVIFLLRKYIKELSEDKEKEDLKVNKYLINYFKKNGDQRVLSYEELHIKYKELENNYQILKKSKGENGMTKGYMKPKEKQKKIADSEIQILVVKRYKKQIDEFENKIRLLENENNDLKKQKERMEKSQKEMLDKFKSYNEDITKMKSSYDIIKKGIQDGAMTKINEANLKTARYQQENNSLKEKVEELLKIGKEREEKELINIEKLKNENEAYKSLLYKNKEEIRVYKEELENFKGEMNKIDSRGLVKIKKLENEKDNILKDKNELEINMGNLNDTIKHKDNQIINLKNNIEALKEELKEREEEIEMLKGKIEEFEKIIKGNKGDTYQKEESEFEYSQSHFNE